MIPKREEARDFFRKTETMSKFSAKAPSRSFHSALNTACRRFCREME